MRLSLLSRSGLLALRGETNFIARRGMAGGPIPARYKVKKNKYVEEWNGRREITEKSFTVDETMAANLLFYVVVLPYGVYTLTRAEFQSKGDRRYKDCI